jgi:hypothetical protein
MSDHFHILLEVPPMPEGGISDEILLKRLGALYNEPFVATVAKDVNEAFTNARERFSAKRKDGTRRMRGAGAPAAGVLWSARDLRVRV